MAGGAEEDRVYSLLGYLGFGYNVPVRPGLGRPHVSITHNASVVRAMCGSSRVRYIRYIRAARAAERKEQVGSSARSERIRTYNYPDDRVTDHRTSVTVHGIPRMLAGEVLDDFIDEALAQAAAAEGGD